MRNKEHNMQSLDACINTLSTISKGMESKNLTPTEVYDLIKQASKRLESLRDRLNLEFSE